jgi:hypothetical protein
VIQGAWTSLPDEPNPFKRLDLKLKATAKCLSTWSSRFIGNIKIQILLATEVILWLDVAMDSRLLSPEERAFGISLRKSCWVLRPSRGPLRDSGRASFGSGRAMHARDSSMRMLAIGGARTSSDTSWLTTEG